MGVPPARANKGITEAIFRYPPSKAGRPGLFALLAEKGFRYSAHMPARQQIAENRFRYSELTCSAPHAGM